MNMEKVINVCLVCDDYDLGLKIQNVLLEKNLIAGSQITEVKSKYWWNNELFNKTEYRVDMKSVITLYKNIYDEVRKIHNYEVFELSYYEINGNRDFLEWVRSEVKNIVTI